MSWQRLETNVTIAGITSADTARLYGTYGPVDGAANKERQAILPSAARRDEDRVEISAQGLLTAQVVAALATFDANPQAFREQSAAFQKELGNRFRAAGVDTSRPIDLTADAEGQVRVANGHPEKDRIEALFAEDPELSNQFRLLSASASLLKAIENHGEFTKAYQQDPKAAIAHSGHLFSGEKHDIHFQFGENKWADSKPR